MYPLQGTKCCINLEWFVSEVNCNETGINMGIWSSASSWPKLCLAENTLGYNLVLCLEFRLVQTRTQYLNCKQQRKKSLSSTSINKKIKIKTYFIIRTSSSSSPPLYTTIIQNYNKVSKQISTIALNK